MPQTYRLYGTTVESTLSFQHHVPSTSDAPDLRLEEGPPASSFSFWPQLEVVSAVEGDDVSVPHALYRHPEEDRHVVRFRDAVDYILAPDAITYHLHDRRFAHAVEIWLLGPILSLWHELRGRPALHASAVAVGDGAIGFLATNKGGKSTLAAGLMQAGPPLLTDDILVLDASTDRVVGRPSYPQMRMWPEQVRHFVGDVAEWPRVVPHLSKRRVAVGPEGFGSFADAGRPVTHLFLPERRSDATDVQWSPLSPQEAVVELLRHSFLPNTADQLGLADRRLPILTALAEQAQVARLVYPEGAEHLPAVAETLRRAAD
jgi:hypothetical protein